MDLLDDDGKLFGVVNVADELVVLLVLAVVVSAKIATKSRLCARPIISSMRRGVGL